MHLPELILSFRTHVKDALFFLDEFAAIDSSIEENIVTLNGAAATLLQDILEDLDMILSRHLILTPPQNNQLQKFEPVNSNATVVMFCQVINDVRLRYTTPPGRSWTPT